MPARFMIDSGVFMRAIDHTHPKWVQAIETKLCRQMWELSVRFQSTKTVLISTITMAEFRFGSPTRFPASTRIEYIAFDELAALNIASWYKKAVITDVCKKTGRSRNVVKYDALIVASAKAHRAEAIVALDDDVFELAQYAQIDCITPDSFLKGHQIELNIV